ncbi:hypothetical protein H5410_059843 [Solanum commersonii]|uniref:Uncharacterized protein n=1 Tax=Solanum commersonii TaxID=4109 RepID=A0A9J5W3I7_SOLCO|nr:hypothetical protein H5410_059843 [Solanum commersonii]
MRDQVSSPIATDEVNDGPNFSLGISQVSGSTQNWFVSNDGLSLFCFGGHILGMKFISVKVDADCGVFVVAFAEFVSNGQHILNQHVKADIL